MTRGTTMVRGHKGMRNGLSLVEMLIAIVLFGLITTIAFAYYKNYYDISLAAKQTRMYAVIDQATQLSGALDVYVAKTGSNPELIQDMVTQRILITKPLANPAISTPEVNASDETHGWKLDTNATVQVAAGGGIIFTMALDGNDSAVVTDMVEYCNILNNAADSDYNLSKVTYGAAKTMLLAYADYNQSMFCANIGAGAADTNLTLVFVKKVAY